MMTIDRATFIASIILIYWFSFLSPLLPFYCFILLYFHSKLLLWLFSALLDSQLSFTWAIFLCLMLSLQPAATGFSRSSWRLCCAYCFLMMRASQFLSFLDFFYLLRHFLLMRFFASGHQYFIDGAFLRLCLFSAHYLAPAGLALMFSTWPHTHWHYLHTPFAASALLCYLTQHRRSRRRQERRTSYSFSFTSFSPYRIYFRIFLDISCFTPWHLLRFMPFTLSPPLTPLFCTMIYAIFAYRFPDTISSGFFYRPRLRCASRWLAISFFIFISDTKILRGHVYLTCFSFEHYFLSYTLWQAISLRAADAGHIRIADTLRISAARWIRTSSIFDTGYFAADMLFITPVLIALLLFFTLCA